MDAILNTPLSNSNLYVKEADEMSDMSLADVAAVTRDGNDFGGGSSAFWIFALIALMGGGFGGWNNRGQAATQDFIQNGFNFNDLQDQNRDILNAITNGTAQAVAATTQAEYEQIAVAKVC